MRAAFAVVSAFAGLLASTSARADAFTYSNFNSTAGLTAFGTATAANGRLQVVDNASGTSGAYYRAPSFNLGSSFTTSFQFQVNSADTSTRPGNGFAFVFASGAGDAGTRVGSLGIDTNVNSVAVQFSNFANVANPLCGTVRCSNLVGVISNGNLDYAANTNYAAPYASLAAIGNSANGITVSGNTSLATTGRCDLGASTSFTRAGCVSNGGVWRANISWDLTRLTVQLTDVTNSLSAWTVVFDNATVRGAFASVGNIVSLGFSGASGTLTNQVQILDWTATSNGTGVPEPASIAALGLGLVAVGAARRRRAA